VKIHAQHSNFESFVLESKRNIPIPAPTKKPSEMNRTEETEQAKETEKQVSSLSENRMRCATNRFRIV